MRFDLLTLHPDLVASPLEHSIIGRAVRDGHIEVGVHDLREHGRGRYRQVDDAPYGGGAGMVLKVDVIAEGLEALRRPGSRVLLMSPAGRRFDQAAARRLACEPHLIFVCGHYEGVDARVEALVDEEISIGDYVLTGGELPALVILESVARLVPGVLGNHDSFQDESFSEGLLEHPQYTRPREFEGMAVPDVLLSGNHAAIERWREEQARARTAARRPDLLERGGS
ncbi:MAG: tRNA (guanosine(37)-N1)-methyltransferase TrmD [Alphaproteobacteria bacterium]|nr:tRNA (guanosine(37)-N1)-methyltransferase TrmD [Alphaproteobacteria bacterium]